MFAIWKDSPVIALLDAVSFLGRYHNNLVPGSTHTSCSVARPPKSGYMKFIAYEDCLDRTHYCPE